MKPPKYLIDEEVPLDGATAECKAWISSYSARGTVVEISTSIIIRCDTCGARFAMSDRDSRCEHHRITEEPEE